MADYTNLEDALEALEAAETALQQADDELEELKQELTTAEEEIEELQQDLRVAEDETAQVQTKYDDVEQARQTLSDFVIHELDDETHRHLVENFNVPTQVLDELAHKRFASPELLTLLADEHEWAVRAAVAEHDNTPTETLTRLAVDGYELVRKDVASNPSTPLSVLGDLLKNEEKSVREQAMETLKTRTNAELAEVLSKHGYEEVTADMPREWLVELLTTI